MSSSLYNNKVVFLVFAGLMLFVLASSSPQCAKSSDVSVNPTLSSLDNPVAQCKQNCIDDFQTAKKAEQARFKAAKVACNGDPDCKQTESDLHDAIVEELVDIKDSCLLGCEHQQGSAVGGQ